MFIFALKQIIMENKLISMVEFVLEYGDVRMNQHMSVQQLHDYATFLNTPLNLGMFKPAVEVNGKWEVLEMPENTVPSCGCTGICDNPCNDALIMEQYQQAKDKVIFEGFEVKWCKSQLDGEEFFGITLNGQWCGSYYNFISSYLKGENTINGLNNLKSKLRPTLTEYGKQISGLNK